MTSLLTNNAAMTALTTLKGISSQLDMTSNRVSTGQRVSAASDNAAYWSIATTVRTDNASLSAVKDSLGLGSSAVDTAYNGVTNVIDQLRNLRAKLQTALQPGVDRTKVQTEIDAIKSNMKAVAASSVSNGQNWLSTDGTTAGQATRNIVAGFSRNAAGVTTFSTIDIDVSTTALYNPLSGGSAGILDKVTSGISVDTLDISATTITDTNVKSYIDLVEKALADITKVGTKLGSSKTQIDGQKAFVDSLMKANDRAIGTLVDADIEEESTKLKALQTQQQLAVQSLSIANSASQNVLSLFR
ncbi:flagellin [Methylobacterium sp. V23]|uniref:flagellin N-terminal helical domain-containing protein n=1 Tax=Methylobacterium sp. V23 TaxID=2044878 RepID=UPI000CDAD270|nr:flagellin [Methylobacterium sp. V23]POR40355.1 flagellin [Methylobacterium sp. V23]